MIHRFSETKIVFAIAAAVFAVYFPCALWIKADYEAGRLPTPSGAAVHLGYFAPVEMNPLPDDLRLAKHQFFQTVFRWKEELGLSPPEEGAIDPSICVYENGTSLGPATIFYVPYSKSYALSFYTSDNSDPRRNGRDYWIVRRSEQAGIK